MTSLSGFNILIIDFPEAHQLRASLMATGATVHVLSPGGALILAGNRHIDAAFVCFGVGPETRRLCERLNALGVGQIILTPGDVSTERQDEERAMLPKLILGMSQLAERKQLDPNVH
jgi:hypothetical protein